MGRGSRHSKNAGIMGSEAMSYAEMRNLGYGNNFERLGKDSIGNFDDCQLTFQSATDPVCTPWGIVFSREAILNYLFRQTKCSKRKLDILEKIVFVKENKKSQGLEQIAQIKFSKFKNTNFFGIMTKKDYGIDNKAQYAIKRAQYNESSQIFVTSEFNIAINRDRTKKVKFFWCNNHNHAVVASRAINLIDKMYLSLHFNKCPITGKKLKYGDLIRVNFTRIKRENNFTFEEFNNIVNTSVQKIKYMDPITKEFLTNRSQLICFRVTGDVFLYEIVKTLLEPHGTYNGYK